MGLFRKPVNRPCHATADPACETRIRHHRRQGPLPDRRGLLALVGVGNDDGAEDIEYLAGKLVRLRIFDDEAGVMNLDVVQTGGEVLVVSQFTLQASTRKGNRPSYIPCGSRSRFAPSL